MSAIETNITLRANRLPALSLAQWEFLRSRPDLELRFSHALATVERVRVEGEEDDALFFRCEPVLSRNNLYALIGELSILIPSADPELAQVQARVWRYLFPEDSRTNPGPQVCEHCNGPLALSA